MALIPDSELQLYAEKREVECAQNGNLNALRPIFQRYSQALYSEVLMPKLRDPRAAEEVLRECLATAVQKIHQFKWQGRSIFFWLRQIAINKALDRHRKIAKERRLQDALSKEALSQSDSSESPEAIMSAIQDRQEKSRNIRNAMEAIRPRYREAIELRLVQERPREECADTMEVSTSTFDVLLYRAIRAFRKHYAQTSPSFSLAEQSI